jgi:hypothetical protein
MTRKIVYPDADAESLELLSGERLAKLENLGEMYDTTVDNLLAFYAGNPQNVASI